MCTSWLGSLIALVYSNDVLLGLQLKRLICLRMFSSGILCLIPRNTSLAMYWHFLLHLMGLFWRIWLQDFWTMFKFQRWFPHCALFFVTYKNMVFFFFFFYSFFSLVEIWIQYSGFSICTLDLVFHYFHCCILLLTTSPLFKVALTEKSYVFQLIPC